MKQRIVIKVQTDVEHNQESSSTQKDDNQSAQLRFIRCPDCGEKILLVPNLALMIEAIERHSSTHKACPNRDGVFSQKPGYIRQNLTEQVLTNASELVGLQQKLWIQEQV